MFTDIFDLKNNKWLSINSHNGKKILKNYIKLLMGGSFVCNDNDLIAPVSIEEAGLASQWLNLDGIHNTVCEENNWVDLI